MSPVAGGLKFPEPACSAFILLTIRFTNLTRTPRLIEREPSSDEASARRD